MLTMDQVKLWYEEAKDTDEVKEWLSSIIPAPEPHELTADEVNTFLNENEEGKKIAQSIGDTRVTSALKTYKEGHFEKEVKARVAAELVKLNPSETPEQKRIREVEAELQEQKAQRERDSLINSIKELAFKEKVDPEFIGGISFNSLEEAALYIKRFKGYVDTHSTNAINEFVSKNKFVPGKGEDTSGKMTFSQYRALPAAERQAMVESGAVDDLIPG